ncbi:Ankyrin repeat and KH domain-containing protein mask [Diplonema papillatum]|nr:Ankyrin repeat and KH domain-containing protein mask [Diplonema papillatum]
MARTVDDVLYYRRMEVVVNRVMMRLLECVLKKRPTNSREVLIAVRQEAKMNLQGTGWLCGACGSSSDGEDVCGSCGLVRNDEVPVSEAGGDSLLLAVRHQLGLREEALAMREKVVEAKEAELGIRTVKNTASEPKPKALKSSRFGDGSDALPSSDKVPEKPVLVPTGYLPPAVASSADGRNALKYLAMWADPRGVAVWPQTTIDNFVSDSDFLVDTWRKRGTTDNEAAMVVRTLFAYTHSQLAPEVLWAVWVPTATGRGSTQAVPNKWEPLIKTAAALEAQFQEARDSVVLRPTSEVRSIFKLTPHTVSQAGAMLRQRKSVDAVGLHIYTNQSNLMVARYDNKHRRNRQISPFSDSVLWVPEGDVLRGNRNLIHDDPAHSELPFPGILEYIAANLPTSELRGRTKQQTWACRPFADAEAKSLVDDCLNQSNQQKPDKRLHERAVELLNRAHLPEQDEFPTVDADLYREIFKRSAAFDDSRLMNPEEIARALTVQCLFWYGRHYLLVLSTTTVETRAPHFLGCVDTGEVIPVYRVVASYWPQQIFYLLNMSMRETQLGNHDAELVIKADQESQAVEGVAGTYYAPQPLSWEDGTSHSPPAFRRRDRGLFGTAHRTMVSYTDGNQWRVTYGTDAPQKIVREESATLSLKAWMLPQVRPLIYFTNRALEVLQEEGDTLYKTYRGIGCALSRDVYSTGKVFVWSQYSSASKDQGVAAAFAKRDMPSAVFTIHGSSCVPVMRYSRFGREAELLFPYNSSFRVAESLTKDQAQILGKENLQLFTLEEVTEVDMHCILVRRLLPYAATTAAASVVFQAEAALKGNKCLELSLSHNAVGHVPSHWQVFFHEPSHGCPIDGSASWEKPSCESQLLDTLEQASNGLPPVKENETPNYLLVASEFPEGKSGTFGLKSLKVASNCAFVTQGTHKRTGTDTLRFEIGSDLSQVVKWEDKWVLYNEDDDDDTEEVNNGGSSQPVRRRASPYLLGEWPEEGGEMGPVVRPAQYFDVPNILAPRCPNYHTLSSVELDRETHWCSVCDNEMAAKVYYACSKCDHKAHLQCLNSVSWGGIKFSLEGNTLVKYLNNEVDVPQITSLMSSVSSHMTSVFVDQNGFETPCRQMWHSSVQRLARLAALALIPHDIPLQGEAYQPAGKLLRAANRLAQRNVDRLRILGKSGENTSIRLQMAGHPKLSGSFWCVTAELRRTAARPGLAVGDEGAIMAARIVSLNVPLKVVGLRNNSVGLDGAKRLLESVKQNTSVVEATLGDEVVVDPELEIYRQALSLRCMYHSCKSRGVPLLDGHLSGTGEQWPRVFSLALGDIPNLELPIAGILDQHPVGWQTMAQNFKFPPRASPLTLHYACKAGLVRAVVPLLDDCKIDPNALDDENVPPLMKAVRQHAFECEEGEAAIKRLVTNETVKRNEALLLAVRACGPKVTGVLLDKGMALEATQKAELLVRAVKNPAYNSDRTAFGRLLKEVGPNDLTGHALLCEAAKVGSFYAIEDLATAGAPVDETDEWQRTALHLIASSSSKLSLGPEQFKVVKMLATPSVLQHVDQNDETVLMAAVRLTPPLAFFILNECVTPRAHDVRILHIASANKYFDTADSVESLALLFPKEVPLEKTECLHHACAAGFLHVARFLIEQNASVVLQNGSGNTPLLCACGSSSFDWAKSDNGQQLIDDLARDVLEVVNSSDESALYRAMANGLIETAAYLLSLGAEIRGADGVPASFALAKTNTFESQPRGREIIKQVVQHESEMGTGYMHGTKLNALYNACKQRRVEYTRLLLELGVSAEMGEGFETALGVACSNAVFGEHLDVFEQLIEPQLLLKLSDPAAEDSHPLLIAVRKTNFAVIPPLLKRLPTQNKDNVILKAVGKLLLLEGFDCVEGAELLQAMMKPKNVNKLLGGMTPLFRAVEAGYLHLTRALLDLGADPSITNANGRSHLVEACTVEAFSCSDGRALIHRLVTPALLNGNPNPLFHATCYGCIEIMEELLSIEGIDVSLAVEDHDEQSVDRNILHEASDTSDLNSPEGCSVLRRVLAQAPPSFITARTTDKKKTPLHLAAENAHWLILELLLQANFDAVKVTDGRNRTALHYIAKNCSAISAGQEMKTFRNLARRPILNMQDTDGNTALHIAAKYNACQAILLLECGASINVANSMKSTAMHLSCFARTFTSEMCTSMLDAGANANAINAWGHVALDYLLHKNPDCDFEVWLVFCFLQPPSRELQRVHNALNYTMIAHVAFH